MASIFVFARDDQDAQRAANSIIDHTSNYLIDEVVVVKKDSGLDKCYNDAIANAVSDDIILLDGSVVIHADVIEGIVNALGEHDGLVTPRIYDGDKNWASFAFDVSLELYPRVVGDSPAISHGCIAAKKSWFNKIGPFRFGDYCHIAAALATHYHGGKVVVTDGYMQSEIYEPQFDATMVATILGGWLPNHLSSFYRIHGDVACGKIDQDPLDDGWVDRFLPELRLHDLVGSASGRSVAIVGPHKSIDYVESFHISKHDIVIGCEYMGLHYDCDYVITDNTKVVFDLKDRYGGRFITPYYLYDNMAGGYVPSEVAGYKYVPSTVYKLDDDMSFGDPVCNVAPYVAAAHIALYMQPKCITMFGCDPVCVHQKYYSSVSRHKNKEVDYHFTDVVKEAIDVLGILAQKYAIPLLKVGHA